MCLHVRVLLFSEPWESTFRHDAPLLLNTVAYVSQEWRYYLTVQFSYLQVETDTILFFLYSPYLNFTSCPNNFLCSKNNLFKKKLFFWSRLQSRVASDISYHVSLVSFNLLVFLRFCVMALTCFKSIDQLRCRMFLSSGFLRFLIIRFR